jgi:hypothetical protein
MSFADDIFYVWGNLLNALSFDNQFTFSKRFGVHLVFHIIYSLTSLS